MNEEHKTARGGILAALTAIGIASFTMGWAPNCQQNQGISQMNGYLVDQNQYLWNQIKQTNPTTQPFPESVKK